MPIKYIHRLPNWPHFEWDKEGLTALLGEIRHQQGRLLGRMAALGFDQKAEASLRTLTQEVQKTSEIEGEQLDAEQVRSSIARQLNMDIGALTPPDRYIDGVVEMVLDATQNYTEELSVERLYGWHATLFPTGYSGLKKIRVAVYRDDKKGPMEVVSGPEGRQKVHFVAPPASKLETMMNDFLLWFDADTSQDLVVKAAIAHLWFVTIHPFEDGNGRIARAIADMMLARSEKSPQRFYSMSSQIRIERNIYYETLESTQKGDLDITPWVQWFFECLLRAVQSAENTFGAVLHKSRFWNANAGVSFNSRQINMLNRLFDGFEGKLTSSKWAKIEKCSQDSASRDIKQLIEYGILMKDSAGGRSTSYSLVECWNPENVEEDIDQETI